MIKYLQQLLGDVEHSIQMANQLPQREWVPIYELDDEEISLTAVKSVSLPSIYELPFEAFPPESLLNDLQVNLLVDSIKRLWANWRLNWNLPPQLTDRQLYKAFLHAMQHEMVCWSVEKGGNLSICQHETGNYCPFGINSGYCHCKALDETIKQDLEIWEEHVRSQGIDPYLDLSEEEEAAFEEARRKRSLQKNLSEEWLMFGINEALLRNEPSSEDSPSMKNDNEDEDWANYFLWDDGLDYNKGQMLPDTLNDDNNDDTEKDSDFDLPIF
ncbi:MAG: hypothetical protein GC192_00140 [Bacteroidetes bacterium]|nr:hypothetical protein [Bacteroidota bacterium]